MICKSGRFPIWKNKKYFWEKEEKGIFNFLKNICFVTLSFSFFYSTDFEKEIIGSGK